ncbi:MAG TPA: amino acid racemase [Geminicoccaceae bacterium]|nr:amino acid racemase [Geminicoccus sp.]HMU50022.1 amino acid racemase [Geminicoccaceae bacterium]
MRAKAMWRGGIVSDRDLTVGVLGGLGPEATVDFMAKVLAATGASTDQEHLHLIVDCNPKVPNRNDAIAGRGPSPAPDLVAMARRLEAAGVDFLVMACNAAHAFAGDIRGSVSIPFVSIIDETVAALQRDMPGLEAVAVLAAGGCRMVRLYENALEAHGITPISPDEDEQSGLMQAIYAIKAGRAASTKGQLVGLGETLVRRGAQAVIAGCTEVPLVLGQGDLSRPMLDSTQALAHATVAYAKRQRLLPSI